MNYNSVENIHSYIQSCVAKHYCTGALSLFPRIYGQSQILIYKQTDNYEQYSYINIGNK